MSLTSPLFFFRAVNDASNFIVKFSIRNFCEFYPAPSHSVTLTVLTHKPFDTDGILSLPRRLWLCTVNLRSHLSSLTRGDHHFVDSLTFMNTTFKCRSTAWLGPDTGDHHGGRGKPTRLWGATFGWIQDSDGELLWMKSKLLWNSEKVE